MSKLNRGNQGKRNRVWHRQARSEQMLFIFVLVLINLALVTLLKAQDFTDTFYGVGAGNTTTTGLFESAFGFYALHNITTGWYNTAIGDSALYNNTIGSDNTASGEAALYWNTTGNQNVANGYYALYFNTTGDQNTASGVYALYHNTTGISNTATGFAALSGNNGSQNVANGSQALSSNYTGSANTANGANALYSNYTGSYNTAEGASALYSNTIATGLTAFGVQALYNNTTGNNNTAIGLNALYNNTTGVNNVGSGYGALFNNTSGSNNIALGTNAGSALTTGNNNVEIGHGGVAAEANTIRLGTTQTRTFIAGIRGRTTGIVNAVPVLIDSAGQLGTTSSSRRFKHEIKPMADASAAILKLEPVTFQYREDASSTPQFGLIAEEVEKVNPDLVVRDEKGEIYTVRYDAVNAMVLNEFLKEHRKVEEQGAIIAKQQKQIEALTAGLQKVSDQLELTRPAPQTVLNDQ